MSNKKIGTITTITVENWILGFWEQLWKSEIETDGEGGILSLSGTLETQDTCFESNYVDLETRVGNYTINTGYVFLEQLGGSGNWSW